VNVKEKRRKRDKKRRMKRDVLVGSDPEGEGVGVTSPTGDGVGLRKEDMSDEDERTREEKRRKVKGIYTDQRLAQG